MHAHRTPDYALVRDSDRARFEAKVDRSPGQGPHGDCHEWTGHRHRKDNYGRFFLQRGQRGAHVVAVFFKTGEWPTGEWPNMRQVMHSCDNPPCVNLAHLSVGTAGDNVRDMHAKGRAWIQNLDAA